MSVRCYLSLGSNLRSPQRQLHQAIRLLCHLPHSRLVKCSKLYFNQAQGLRAQPPFYNAVVSLDTTLAPLQLLHHCQTIENSQGRVRKKRWGARTLDIDILIYGQLQCKTPKLTLPHPRLNLRDFVLIPLRQLMPNLCFDSASITSKPTPIQIALSARLNTGQ